MSQIMFYNALIGLLGDEGTGDITHACGHPEFSPCGCLHTLSITELRTRFKLSWRNAVIYRGWLIRMARSHNTFDKTSPLPPITKLRP